MQPDTQQTDRYAVIGNPVAHSKSPEIHALFARATGQALRYEKVLAPIDGFPQVVAALIGDGLRGANVTQPFKLEAFALATRLTARARLAGAVNTLVFEQDGIAGDNTDGIGLANDIVGNLGATLAGAQVLLVGAGGAARGALGPLLDQRPARLVISNRSADKAGVLAAQFAAYGNVRAAPLAELSDQHFDLVINATAAGLSNELPSVPPACFAANALAYDMMYGRPSAFLRLAAAAGARTADGFGMLVEQAAEAFFLWRGVRPATAPVIAQLRARAAG